MIVLQKWTTRQNKIFYCQKPYWTLCEQNVNHTENPSVKGVVFLFLLLKDSLRQIFAWIFFFFFLQSTENPKMK